MIAKVRHSVYRRRMRRAIMSRRIWLWNFAFRYQSYFPLNAIISSAASARYPLCTSSAAALASVHPDSKVSSQYLSTPPDSTFEAEDSTNVDYSNDSYSDVAHELLPSDNSDVLLEEGNDAEGSVRVEGKEHEIELDVEKLEAVLSLLQSSTDDSFEKTLEEMSLFVNQEVVLKIVETPFVPGESLVQFLTWASKEFSMTSRILEAVVDVICKSQKAKASYALLDFVKKIGSRGNKIVNPTILNKMIAMFSKLGKAKAGFQVFESFVEFDCIPNEETYFLTIQALCKRAFFDWAWSVCEKMLEIESLPGNDETGRIITWFCRGNMPREAHMVYLAAKRKNKLPSLASVNSLVYSLCRVDDLILLGAEMLDEFSDEKRKRAINSFSSVIHGLCRIKDIDGAKKLLYKMIDIGPPPGNCVFNMIINTLSKAGDLTEAMKMMKLMEKRGLKPDVYTYAVIMSGYTSGGQMEEACEVLNEAKTKHAKLSSSMFHTLIRGFCKLEEFDKALALFREMRECGVNPNSDEYNKLIQSLCMLGLDWRTAAQLYTEMEENGLRVNESTRGLIKAVKELEKEELGSAPT